ncbi:aspartyl-tRNA synthetase, mitochondrial isoform X1 [Leptinotarsa decemlineata]|uniref:aspartyl-tRNA synthetase, mitochondrial isoform X1 n=2 Tax=Leptinotarsa decemlineata TaxID=7539 RepID=UPI003D30986F
MITLGRLLGLGKCHRFFLKEFAHSQYNHKCFRNILLKFPKYNERSYATSRTSSQVYLIDENESQNVDNVSISKYTNRTHTCGELTSENIGQSVTLCGWLEYQRMNKFVVLRDGYGETQLIVKEKDTETQSFLEVLPFESIIEVKGTVLSRPKGMENKNQKTGEIEVSVEKFRVVNKARDNLPFNIREFQKAKEPLRMQYRYLDLRFPIMQQNLRLRSKLLMKMREFLINNHFIDVETPTLFKATPGGAQEFIVPTQFPGQFYSLVQSPQQFKQMLMAGAIDRYFQIARCYRDEGVRSDRQPEFTQLDIELSFTNVDSVIKLIEDLLQYSWPQSFDPIPMRFQKMSYEEAMENYGSDKPDVRFDYKVKNCTDLFKINTKLASEENFGAYFISFPKEHANLSKQIKDSLQTSGNKYERAKLIQSKIVSTSEWLNKIGKLLTTQLASRFVEEYKIQDESVLFLAYGNKDEVLSLLGKVRLEYVNFLENLGMTIRKKGNHFLWVVDFPLFELSENSNKLQCVHHPFTAPHPDDMSDLETNPLKVRSLAYDLVMNGQEIGGGSIRIHDPALQKRILEKLNIETDSMQHILDMLGSGCPPHGGIALGLDRFLSVLLNTASIRDVIAFPKNFDGRDPLSGAPSSISEEEQRLYHIKSVLSPKKK